MLNALVGMCLDSASTFVRRRGWDDEGLASTFDGSLELYAYVPKWLRSCDPQADLNAVTESEQFQAVEDPGLRSEFDRIDTGV